MYIYYIHVIGSELNEMNVQFVVHTFLIFIGLLYCKPKYEISNLGIDSSPPLPAKKRP